MKVIYFSDQERKLTLELSFDELRILCRVATTAASKYDAMELEEEGMSWEEVDQFAEDISGALAKATIEADSKNLPGSP